MPKRTKDADTARDLDDLAERLRGVDPERLAPHFTPTTLTIRLTEAKKAELRAAAQALGVTVTAYLLGCHEAVSAMQGVAVSRPRKRRH